MKMTPNFTPLNPANLTGDLAVQLRHMMADGRLNPGDKLPSTRTLAKDLGVARGTVISALEALIAEGFLEARHGSGTYVSASIRAISPTSERLAQPPRGEIDVLASVGEGPLGGVNFQACRPSMEAFPQAAWRKVMANAASKLPDEDYGDPQGELELRIAIASYLCRARGLDVNPDQILITNGAMQAINLIAQLFLKEGDIVGFENPGYPLARQAFELEGAQILPVPIDQGGLRVESLDSSLTRKPKLIYATPSHQFPTGARLSLERRQKLIAWAQSNNALILEDDYDGEFRYDIAPLPPMAAMITSGFVMYLGTFSKTLFPALRIGYAAGDKKIIQQLTKLRIVRDYQTNTITQIALAQFISTGDFEKHVHRMRRIYAKKRACLQDAISVTNFPGALSGMNSGLNGLIKLETDLSATNIASRAELHKMSIPAISRYDCNQSLEDNALVLGYAALSETEIRTGIELLAQLVQQT